MKSKKDIQILTTTPFKLKDKRDRSWKAFNLKSQFGFLPESIIISKVDGKNNLLILSAVIPKKK